MESLNSNQWIVKNLSMVENSGDTDCCTYNINNMLNSKKGEIWQSLISKLAFSASCVYLNLLF